ncbi:unnamed protein product [Symbiodinium necroappetens]|uniref:Uncharacterized protein n=1 Tax=Symbiodinium necroappetens TaxID=1628268 RepID=A0A813BYV6_9DINO|nr:unnamed protein product [Symbiodinium necroappetens]
MSALDLCLRSEWPPTGCWSVKINRGQTSGNSARIAINMATFCLLFLGWARATNVADPWVAFHNLGDDLRKHWTKWADLHMFLKDWERVKLIHPAKGMCSLARSEYLRYLFTAHGRSGYPVRAVGATLKSSPWSGRKLGKLCLWGIVTAQKLAEIRVGTERKVLGFYERRLV